MCLAYQNRVRTVLLSDGARSRPRKFNWTNLKTHPSLRYFKLLKEILSDGETHASSWPELQGPD